MSLYVLTRDGVPVRKASNARDAWADDAVPGHPTTCEGISVSAEGIVSEVSAHVPGSDVWRVLTDSGKVAYFYGNKRDLFREFGAFTSADRLEWDGWVEVYG